MTYGPDNPHPLSTRRTELVWKTARLFQATDQQVVRRIDYLAEDGRLAFYTPDFCIRAKGRDA